MEVVSTGLMAFERRNRVHNRKIMRMNTARRAMADKITPMSTRMLNTFPENASMSVFECHYALPLALYSLCVLSFDNMCQQRDEMPSLSFSAVSTCQKKLYDVSPFVLCKGAQECASRGTFDVNESPNLPHARKVFFFFFERERDQSI